MTEHEWTMSDALKALMSAEAKRQGWTVAQLGEFYIRTGLQTHIGQRWLADRRQRNGNAA